MRMLPEFLKISDDVLVQEVAGESVMLDLASEQYFGMNDVGTCFLAAIREGQTVAAAMARIADRFEVEPAVLAADIGALIDDLLRRGLVHVIEG